MADSKVKRGAASACYRNHDLVVRMATSGATIVSIAKAVGTNHHRVRGYLTRHDIRRPAWREPPPGSHPMARNVRGPLNNNWKGGRYQDKRGYWLIWMPEHPEANRHGCVREHRILMEKKIGRRLRRKEVVDHIDGNPANNKIENLRLFPTNGHHLRATLTGVPCPARGRKRVASPLASRRGGRRSRDTRRRRRA